jgi:hypothetical protein
MADTKWIPVMKITPHRPYLLSTTLVRSFSTDNSKRAQQMTNCEPLPSLFALLLSSFPAMHQAVSRSYSAGFYVEGCKDFLAANSSFFAGRCVGAVEVLDALNDDMKLFCPPAGATNLQKVQVVVDYIKKRPDRKNADFRLVANEAMAKGLRPLL